MDHAARKTNYFGFDKSSKAETEGCLLICTDVASRGMDFKNVGWIVQYDVTS